MTFRVQPSALKSMVESTCASVINTLQGTTAPSVNMVTTVTPMDSARRSLFVLIMAAQKTVMAMEFACRLAIRLFVSVTQVSRMMV